MAPAARRYKLILSYDGAGYHGWQKQPGKANATVQGTLEAALLRLFGEDVTITGSGRTDTGVHALGQVAHMDLRVPVTPSELQAALNGQLPPDIRVRHVARVSNDFHARYSATRRAYAYLIHRTRLPSPFLARYTLACSFPLDVDALADASARLVGTHDFSAFRATGGGRTLPTRTIYRSEILELSEDFLCYLVVADAFLRKMVRGIVGTLLEIGRGKVPPDRMTRLLDTGDRSLLSPLAPPQGLYLVAVAYPDGLETDGGDPVG